jgi:hypothetical protein
VQSRVSLRLLCIACPCCLVPDSSLTSRYITQTTMATKSTSAADIPTAVPPKATTNGTNGTNGSSHNNKEDSSSTENSTPPASRVNSVGSDLNELGSGKTLASRSKIPVSMYVVALLVVGAQFSGGVYSTEVLQSMAHSIVTSAYEAKRSCE